MRSFTAYTIGLAGAGYTAVGVGSLLYPRTMMDLLAQPLAVANVISVSGLALGGYYCLAAYQENWPFFFISATGRWVMFAVLWRHRGVTPAWRQLALIEGAGAVVTDLVFLYEWFLGRKVISDANVEKKPA